MCIKRDDAKWSDVQRRMMGKHGSFETDTSLTPSTCFSQSKIEHMCGKLKGSRMEEQ